MSTNEINSSEFFYQIDQSYGLSQDGYIATGTESIVYKGLKISKDKKIVLSCVLKFKYKKMQVYQKNNDRTTIDILSGFKEKELKIFDSLQNCRSVVRIYDVIEDLGDFSLLDRHVSPGRPPLLIDNERFFCVVEEFIDGWSLEEYCRDVYWGLTQTRELQYGLKEKYGFHDFPAELQKEKIESYKHDYDTVLRYQHEIYGFMINLCEIMQYVTEEKNILHLDIKPDNIMVTRHGRELVLIDFGRSEYINEDGYFQSNMADADYSSQERIERMFQYGTLGYAAPESYVKPVSGTNFPLDQNKIEYGRLSIESDIFSFGATFWECLNMFELYTGSREFAKDKGEGGSYSFYRNHVFNNKAYCDRDLSLTTKYYHSELEKIILKCTRTRTPQYQKKTNTKYYHSYKKLKKDIIKARDSSPTIARTENIKVRNSFSVVGVILGLIIILFCVRGVLGVSYNYLSQKKWEAIKENYNGTKIERLGTIGNDLIQSTPEIQRGKVYEDAYNFLLNNDGMIDSAEATVLVSMLESISDKRKLSDYINDIVKNADERRYGDIVKEIFKLDPGEDCIGYNISEAIYNIEMYGYNDDNIDNIMNGYELLQKYRDNNEFHSIIVRLKNTLNHDDVIKMISRENGKTRIEIKEEFESIL